MVGDRQVEEVERDQLKPSGGDRWEGASGGIGGGVGIEQCQSSARAVPEQCQSSVRAVSEQCQSSVRAVPEQCQSSARAVPEQCQIVSDECSSSARPA